MRKEMLNAIHVLPFLFLFSITGPASGAISTANFTVEVNAVNRNSSGLPVAVGDSLNGSIVLDTSKAVDSTPGAPYADYVVNGGAFVSIVINGAIFTKPIDLVSVTNDRLISPPNNFFLDRFFANAGDINVFGSDGIQFWIDQQTTDVVPTLLGTRKIPVPLSLNLQLATANTFIFRSSEFDIQGSFTTFAANDPTTLLQQLAADVAGVGPTTLADKVRQARVYYMATCTVLTNFVKQVKTLRAKKKLTSAKANELIAEAQAIKDSIGCY